LKLGHLAGLRFEIGSDRQLRFLRLPSGNSASFDAHLLSDLLVYSAPCLLDCFLLLS
jgi:hypothetical protein